MNNVRRARYDKGWLDDPSVEYLRVCHCSGDMKALVYHPPRRIHPRIWFCTKCKTITAR